MTADATSRRLTLGAFGWSISAPQLTFTIAAVMLRGQSEAAKAAALPTSWSVAARPSSVCLSIISMRQRSSGTVSAGGRSSAP